MIPTMVENLLATPTEEAKEQLFEDESAVFWVDWREDDKNIVEYCEGVLQTGQLSAETVDIANAPGFELNILYGNRRVRVPLTVSGQDRHITLHTLNQLLTPDFEIRVCVDSNEGDTLAFLPLPAADWAALESRFGPRVDQHFRRITETPNLFTDSW